MIKKKIWIIRHIIHNYILNKRLILKYLLDNLNKIHKIQILQIITIRSKLYILYTSQFQNYTLPKIIDSDNINYYRINELLIVVNTSNQVVTTHLFNDIWWQTLYNLNMNNHQNIFHPWSIPSISSSPDASPILSNYYYNYTNDSITEKEFNTFIYSNLMNNNNLLIINELENEITDLLNEKVEQDVFIIKQNSKLQTIQNQLSNYKSYVNNSNLDKDDFNISVNEYKMTILELTNMLYHNNESIIKMEYTIEKYNCI